MEQAARDDKDYIVTRDDMGLTEVPSQEDLYRLLQHADQSNLEYMQETGKIPDDRTKINVREELFIRRTEALEELLDAERYIDNDSTAGAPLVYEDGENTTFVSIGAGTIDGVTYPTNSMDTEISNYTILNLAESVTELQTVLRNENYQELNMPNNPLTDTAKQLYDFHEEQGKDVNLREYWGIPDDGPIDPDERMNTQMGAARKARNELDDHRVVYFSIEGFNMEEIASLIQRVRPRDRFESLQYESRDDLSMNEDDWESFHKEWIQKNTKADNALRLLYDDDE